MKEVYGVKTEAVVSGEIVSSMVLFTSERKAQKKFAELVEEDIKGYGDELYSNTNCFEKAKWYWNVWEDGNYNSEHTLITIETLTLDEDEDEEN